MLQVTGLCHHFGKTQVLHDLDFSVRQGEILGFLGPNGAGKSTTMRILTGYLTPSRGEVTFDSRSIDKYPLALRKALGYLPENVPVYPELTVRECLDWTAKVKLAQNPAGSVAEALDRCGLARVEKSLIRHLSKGFRQRLGLAQSILGPTRLLILDEPTVGLDPSQIREIRSLITELGREKTIILSTHILPEVERTCHRVLIINKGRIVAEDTPGNLTRGKGRYLLRLGLDEAGLEAARGEYESMEHVLRVQTGESGAASLFIETEPERDLRPDITALAVNRGWPVLEFKPADATLEEAFVDLVKEEPHAS